MARIWTPEEIKLLKKKYPTHSTRELVWALAAAGYERTRPSVRDKLSDLGLRKNMGRIPFAFQVTIFCDRGDAFIPKVEEDKRKNGTPYIVARNEKGQEAIFCEPLNDERGEEPQEYLWVRWFKHPIHGTWPY